MALVRCREHKPSEADRSWEYRNALWQLGCKDLEPFPLSRLKIAADPDRKGQNG